MNDLFDFAPLAQAPDSTQTQNGSSFMEMNSSGFMKQQTSIMSAGFQNKSVDSLVKAKTKKLRKRKKKVIKTYQYVDSYLIVKKDSFAFLQNMQNPPFTSFNPHLYILNTSPIIDSNLIVEPLNVAHQIEVSPFANAISSNGALKNSLEDSLWLSPNQEQTPIYNLPVISDYKQALDFVIVKSELVVIEDTLKDEFIEEIKIVDPISTRITSHPLLSAELWLMGLLLALLFLMAFIKFQFNAKLKTYLQSVFSFQSFYKMFKEQNITNKRLSVMLSVIYFLNISLVAYYSFLHFDNFQTSLNHYFSFPYILGMILLGYMAFTIVNTLIAFVFESYTLLKENLYNLFFSNRILGLVLLPLVVLYPYVPENITKFVLFLLWVVVAGSFILRWFRGLQISFKHKVPYSYMFLYLCTLEIIPIIIIIKTILE